MKTKTPTTTAPRKSVRELPALRVEAPKQGRQELCAAVCCHVYARPVR